MPDLDPLAVAFCGSEVQPIVADDRAFDLLLCGLIDARDARVVHRAVLDSTALGMLPMFIAQGLALSSSMQGPAPASSPLEGEGAELSLSWNAPVGCPDAEAVERAFRRYVGEESVAPIEARGRVTFRELEYRLELSVAGEEKVLRSDSCSDLSEAAAVILSIAATDAETLASAIEADQMHEPAARATPATEALPVAVTRGGGTPDELETSSAPGGLAPPPRHARSLRGAVRVDAGFRYGIMPSYSGDGAVAAGLIWSKARIELVGTFWSPQKLVLDPDAGTRLWVTLGAVEARGCWTPKRRRLEFPLCGGLELGAVRFDPRGALSNARQHRMWVGVSAGAALVWLPRSRFGIWVGPEAVVALRRSEFKALGSSYQLGRAAIRGVVGVEFRFP